MRVRKLQKRRRPTQELSNHKLYTDSKNKVELLSPFHTARVMPASALILRAHLRKGVLFTWRGPSQTNCYCFQWSLSHGTSAGHRQCAGVPLVGQAPAPVQKGAMGHFFQCTSSPAPCKKNPFTGVCPQCKRRRGHHPRRVKGALPSGWVGTPTHPTSS